MIDFKDKLYVDGFNFDYFVYVTERSLEIDYRREYKLSLLFNNDNYNKLVDIYTYLGDNSKLIKATCGYPTFTYFLLEKNKIVNVMIKNTNNTFNSVKEFKEYIDSCSNKSIFIHSLYIINDIIHFRNFVI